MAVMRVWRSISTPAPPAAPLHRWLRRVRASRPEVAEQLEQMGLDRTLLERVEMEGVPLGLSELLKVVAVSAPRGSEEVSKPASAIDEELPPERWPRRRGNPRRAL